MTRTEVPLSELYLEDETAWLEAMADLIRAGRHAELDYAHLREYLTDMSRRDRREVRSRLVGLLLHILKWVHQPDRRSRSWRGSIIAQRQELSELASPGVLRKHAEAVLADVYLDAVELATAETGLSRESFPMECGYSLDELLAFEPHSSLPE